MEIASECNRCGLCCFYLKDGRKVKCKHLRYNRRLKRTYCKIYFKRNFQLSMGENPVIDYYIDPVDDKRKPVICLSRVQMKKNYPGCSFNKEEYEDG